jgi:hypothetical protein
MAANCNDTKKRNRRVMACGPPCCEPIYCFVETKACHASQHKNGFRQNTHDENGRPLVRMKPGAWGQMVFAEPLKYYLRSTKTVSWNESCRSGVTWWCFRGLGIFICRFGVSNDSSSQMEATHTIEKFDGGRAGCESGTLGGSGSARSNGKEGNVTGGGSVYGWPCGYKSFRSGSSSRSDTTYQYYGKTDPESGPMGVVSTTTTSNTTSPDTGCYEPYIKESSLPEVIAVYNESYNSPNHTRTCSGSVNVVSWHFCPGPDDPPEYWDECIGLNYTATGLTCDEWGTSNTNLGRLSGYGHFSFGGPASEWVKPGTKASITTETYSHQLSSCADSITSTGKNQSTGEGNNNRQGPWSPNEIPDGDGSSTSGYGGTGENGGGQASEGQSSQPIWTNNPFPPLQGAQNSPASTQSAYQQTPPTRPLPPVSQHPPSLHDAYINGVRPTYPIHGGSSPTSGGNAPSWTGVWGSTVDGTTWWYQQGTTASGSSYAEGSYYISPGNWGYQFTQW